MYRMRFPRDFVWGAAAAAYQIEGAAADDGKGPSIWDHFCRKANAIFESHTGERACDHYHRWRDDVALMKSLNLRAYRLSLSWPRIIPQGTGALNQKGLAFYDELVDALLQAGITPYVTLFHWDYPLALQHRGGWLNTDSPNWFADYSRVVAERLGDRVRNWITLNEPQVFLEMGHRTGIHAPGLKLGRADLLRAAHHVLLAHGQSVQVLRAHCEARPTVGWAPVGIVRYPAQDDAEHLAAAQRAMWTTQRNSLWSNTYFSDPVCLGKYPEDAAERWARDMPAIGAGDMAMISQPLDFMGVNIYMGDPVAPLGKTRWKPVPRTIGTASTTMQWPVEPSALYWGPKLLYERYKLPIMITENGMAAPDWVALDGKVHDPARIDFTRRYLRELRRAIGEGVDVRGYFYWSIMDNFEWAEGYRQRFGLVHVDYQTMKRTPKESAYWYAEVIARNGEGV